MREGQRNRRSSLLYLAHFHAPFVKVFSAFPGKKPARAAGVRNQHPEQSTLDLNTGEYYDMAFLCDWCNNSGDNARRGYDCDLTDLLQDEAPPLYSAVDPWRGIGTLKGRVCGVPGSKTSARKYSSA